MSKNAHDNPDSFENNNFHPDVQWFEPQDPEPVAAEDADQDADGSAEAAPVGFTDADAPTAEAVAAAKDDLDAYKAEIDAWNDLSLDDQREIVQYLKDVDAADTVAAAEVAQAAGVEALSVADDDDKSVQEPAAEDEVVPAAAEEEAAPVKSKGGSKSKAAPKDK